MSGLVFDLAEDSLRHNTRRLERTIATCQSGLKPRLLHAKDQTREAATIVDEVKKLISQGTHPSDICVLFRTNRLSITLQQAMAFAGISYFLPNDDDFFALPHIKAVI